MPDRSCIDKVTDALFEYETQKVVKINSKPIGAIFRTLQLVIIIYFLFWVIIFEKGYQNVDKTITSGVAVKVKGVSFSNVTPKGSPSLSGPHIWDAADYLIPPQQNSAFFVTTNLVVTANQTQGRCPESSDVYNIQCQVDSDCVEGELVHLGSGMKTGRCVPDRINKGVKVCEIYGWCPTQNVVLPVPGSSLINSAPDFTVMLKNSIEFPYHGVKRQNILPWMSKRFLYTCRYNPDDEKDRLCPIFRLGDILKYTGADHPNIWIFGGMVSIDIVWDCNLDYSVESCVPKYSFRRLDDSQVSKGINFPYAYQYIEKGVISRTLMKAYGIQFLVTVYGKAGKFNLSTFTMNLGSCLALLIIATIICDLIILNIRRYRQAKVERMNQGQSVTGSQLQPQGAPLDEQEKKADISYLPG